MFIEIERIKLVSAGDSHDSKAEIMPPMMINTRTIDKIESAEQFADDDNLDRDRTPYRRGEARALRESGCTAVLHIGSDTNKKIFIKSPTYKELRSLLKPQFISDFMNTV